MVNVDTVTNSNIKTINREKLKNINVETGKFMAKHIFDLMFSTDKMSKRIYLKVLYTGEDASQFESVGDLLEKDKDNVVLSCTERTRVESVYNPKVPNEDIKYEYFETKYIDYSFAVELAEANEFEFNLVSEERKDECIFELAWADKNKFTEIESPEIDWIPKKKYF